MARRAIKTIERASVRAGDPSAGRTNGEAGTSGPGRPRCEATRANILQAANQLLDERGFKATTMEAIAERSGASKVTLYRWWPNKAAIVMEAFFSSVTDAIPFQHSDSALEDLRAQMVSMCRLLHGRPGSLLANLVAEGVVDGELGNAFRERWVAPRRAQARETLRRGIERGEVASDLDLEVVLDALFGPIYYRLIVRHQPLSRTFAEKLWTSVLKGILRRR